VVLVLHAGHISGSTKSWHLTFVMVTCWSVISTINAGSGGMVFASGYPSCVCWILLVSFLCKSLSSSQVYCLDGEYQCRKSLLSVLYLYCSSWIDCLKTTIACMIILDVYTMGGCKLFQLLICFLTVSREVIEVKLWTWLRSDVWSALIVLSITLSDHSICHFPKVLKWVTSIDLLIQCLLDS